MNLALLAEKIGARLEGALVDLPIQGVSTLTRAGPQEISFYSNGTYREELAKTQAAAVIIAPKNRHLCKVPVLLIDNPYLGYARAANLFNPPAPVVPGIHATAWIAPTANIAPSAYIGANVVIEAQAVIGDYSFIGPGCILETGVKVGAYCQLKAQVTLCTLTRLGNRVIVHPGAVIGSDGFGLANDQGIWVKVPHLGGVILGDDVEIGANTTIDKGSLGDTVLENGVKLDNQIQIAHNVHIGEHTAIAGCVGIAGSTRVGKHCIIGGGVAIAGHLELVDHVHITGGSMILQSIDSPGVYSSGTPLQTNRAWHRNYHRFKQLDELFKRIQQLEEQVKHLQESSSG